ncbi:MAG: 3-deoxy-7-phosphoheptulonate synthase, partial [Terriglobia bacterium]
MIISMRPRASREEIDAVCNRIREFGYKVHSIEGEERVVIGAVGVGDVTACLESLEAMQGVERAMRISAPYKFVSREFRAERSVIRVNGIDVGGTEFVMMAGPCSVESEAQIMETAEAVAAAGARLLRGGAFKPRTSPYDFQGLEVEGLKLLGKASAATGLGIITEVMSQNDVDLVAEYADVLQIGARNMQNFALLKALGKCEKPVLLKRGLSSTIKELLMSAEYVVAHGNL